MIHRESLLNNTPCQSTFPPVVLREHSSAGGRSAHAGRAVAARATGQHQRRGALPDLAAPACGAVGAEAAHCLQSDLQDRKDHGSADWAADQEELDTDHHGCQWADRCQQRLRRRADGLVARRRHHVACGKPDRQWRRGPDSARQHCMCDDAGRRRQRSRWPVHHVDAPFRRVTRAPAHVRGNGDVPAHWLQRRVVQHNTGDRQRHVRAAASLAEVIPGAMGRRRHGCVLAREPTPALPVHLGAGSERHRGCGSTARSSL